MDQNELALARNGRMVVFVEGEKTHRRIDRVEVSQNPFVSSKEIPELFLGERMFETIEGIQIIKVPY